MSISPMYLMGAEPDEVLRVMSLREPALDEGSGFRAEKLEPTEKPRSRSRARGMKSRDEAVRCERNENHESSGWPERLFDRE